MKAVCGADCDNCDLFKNKECKGCVNTDGCPFGKKCWIAKYIEIGGKDSFNKLKSELISEINNLEIEGMDKIDELYPLRGEFINLEYPLPNGNTKFLNDNEAYLGNQVECIFNNDVIKRCFGIVCNMNFIMICEYGENCINPELILYKKR